MKKTLLKAKHPGQHANGFGNCHTRWSNNGYCSGVRLASWLNSLGPDDEVYLFSTGITNGQVRLNWLHGSNHLEEDK